MSLLGGTDGDEEETSSDLSRRIRRKVADFRAKAADAAGEATERAAAGARATGQQASRAASAASQAMDDENPGVRCDPVEESSLDRLTARATMGNWEEYTLEPADGIANVGKMAAAGIGGDDEEMSILGGGMGGDADAGALDVSLGGGGGSDDTRGEDYGDPLAVSEEELLLGGGDPDDDEWVML